MLRGGRGDDILIGGPGGDRLVGGRGDDSLRGQDGADTLLGGGNDDGLVGGPGRDELYPGRGHNSVAGGDDRDTVRYDPLVPGRVEVDLVDGSVTGSVVDTIARVEDVVATAGQDVIVGTAIANRLHGGAGDDLILPGLGDDRVIGGAGYYDTVSYQGLGRASTGGVKVDLVLDKATGAGDDDALVSVEGIIGTAYYDRLRGDAELNEIDGRGGIDRIYPGGGYDLLHGGAGEYFDGDVLRGDTLVYADQNYPFGVEVDLAAGTVVRGGGGLVDGFEAVVGTSFQDVLIGDAKFNMLWGGGGDDRLEGRGDVDWLGGGPGNDHLMPGPGGGRGDDNHYSWGDDGYDIVSFADVDGDVYVEADPSGGWNHYGASEGAIAGVEEITGLP